MVGRHSLSFLISAWMRFWLAGRLLLSVKLMLSTSQAFLSDESILRTTSATYVLLVTAPWYSTLRTSSVRLGLGWVYSYLSSDTFLAVGWAALTTASATAVTKRFSSLPRFLNDTSSAAGRAATGQQASSSAPAA